MYSYLLGDYFFSACQQYSRNVAFISDTEHKRYSDLYVNVLSCVSYLRSHGIKPRDRCLLHAPNTYSLVVLYWACVVLGATITIIPYESTDDALSQIIGYINPMYSIGYQLSEDQLKCHKCYQHSSVINFENAKDFEGTIHCNDIGAASKIDHVVSSDLAMIILTSGSTGNAKGVMLSHDNIISAARSIQAYLLINEFDVILNALPLHFDYGLYQMILAFFQGACLVLENGVYHPDILIRNIINFKVTILPIVPSIAILINNALKTNVLCQSVKKITNTGERLNSLHISIVKNIFPNADIFLMYGLTECKRCTYVPPENLNIKINSVGIPMPNIDIFILNDNGDFFEKPYELGEVAISGPSVMQGYWKDTVNTDKKIRVDNNHRKILLSGDLGYFDNDGYLYLQGRLDHIQKLRGAKFDSQLYIKKVESLKNVLRCYLFIHTDKILSDLLFVCVEVSEIEADNTLTTDIRAQFPAIHQPAFIYKTRHFQNLHNGKISFKSIEYAALLAYKSER